MNDAVSRGLIGLKRLTTILLLDSQVGSCETDWELVRMLGESDVIFKGEFLLRNGKKSNYYSDIKKAYGYPKLRERIINDFEKRIDRRATCVAGGGHGGITPAAIIADRQNLKLTTIREIAKTLDSNIEGYKPEKGDKYIIIDDVCTSGESIREIGALLENKGAEVLGAYVVVNRGNSKLPYPLSYMMTGVQLLESHNRFHPVK